MHLSGWVLDEQVDGSAAQAHSAPVDVPGGIGFGPAALPAGRGVPCFQADREAVVTISTVTLDEFCDRLIEYRQGSVEDALRDFFRLMGQKDPDACHIASGHSSEDVEAELARAAQRYREN
jgi:hypothetical protein